jgi:MFS family permease
MLLPGLTNIIKELNLSYNSSSWILSEYLMAGAVYKPIVGKLSDIYGKKKSDTNYNIGILLGSFYGEYSLVLHF